jgi:hypothetical protein
LKTRFKFVGDKYIGDSTAKDGTLKLIVNPGDIVEIDTEECTIKNITTGAVGRQRNQDMIRGNKELGISSLIERLNVGLHYEEIEAEETEEEPLKKAPRRPSGSTNKRK